MFLQSLLVPCCLMKILGVLHPSGSCFSPARVQIHFRSISNHFSVFLHLSSSSLHLNLVCSSRFLYLCRFLFCHWSSKTFIHLRGVAEPSPSSFISQTQTLHLLSKNAQKCSKSRLNRWMIFWLKIIIFFKIVGCSFLLLIDH